MMDSISYKTTCFAKLFLCPSIEMASFRLCYTDVVYFKKNSMQRWICLFFDRNLQIPTDVYAQLTEGLQWVLSDATL